MAGNNLATLSDDVFRKLVDKDLRETHPDRKNTDLRLPENVDRWYSVLLSMSKSVEGQLSARKSDWDALRSRLDAEIEEATDPHLVKTLKDSRREEHQKWLKWRGNIIRFKTGLDEVIAEARHVRDRSLGKIVEKAVTEEKNRLEQRVMLLEQAIQLHHDRTAKAENDRDQELADEDLWSQIHMPSSSFAH